MMIDNTPTAPRATFKDWGEAIAYATLHADIKGGAGSCKKKDTASFTETKSLPAALDLARHGWPEGLDMMKEIKDAIGKSVRAQLPVVVPQHDVTGDLIDMGAFMSGQPECFIAFEELRDERVKSANGKIIRLLVNGTCSCYITTTQIRNRGAGILAAVDILETLGFTVELDMSFSTAAGGARSTVMIPLKRAGEMLDLDRCAFAFSHPSMLRRFVFAIWEGQTQEVRDLFGYKQGGGYGTPTELSDEDQARSDLYYPTIKSGFNELSDGQNEAIRILTEFGIGFEK